MTFSIAARSSDAKLFGMAIASSSPAVAARCAHARSRVGVVATQNLTDPALGPAILERLSRGEPAGAALDAVLTATPFAAYRQLIVIGAGDAPLVHTGEHALGIAGSAVDAHAAAAGNLLARADVPHVMLDTFASTAEHLGFRLLRSLIAGLQHGGEAGPIRSAGLLVVREVSWPIVDLRVDWSDAPISELARLWELFAPQIEDYVQRALDPQAAPGFGVPGER